MRKLIPALLALCFLLSSCNILTLEYKVTGDTTHKLSDGAPTTSYSELQSPTPVTLPSLDPQNSADRYLSTLPSMDFEKKYFGENLSGATAYFSIATATYAPVFESADEISGSSVAKALNALEEKYNIDIVNTPYTADEFDAKIKESELSGRYFADLLSLPQDLAKTYATAEYCEAIGTLPYIDQNAPYFVNEVFRYGGDFGKYAVLGESSYLTKDLSCLYFDASALDDEIYSKALDGALDWRYVCALMEKTGRGISVGADTDISLSHVFRLSIGARYAQEDTKTSLKISPFITTEQTVAAETAALTESLEKFLAFVDDEDPLFVVDTIGNFKNYTSQVTRYGILPLPSAEGGETFGFVSQSRVNYWLCPSHTTTAEGAGIVIAALCAASCQTEAEVLLTLIRDNARDNGTLLVSHLLFAKPAWDFEFLNTQKTEP